MVAVDTSGNLYIADGDNNVVRKVTASTGIIATVAGTGIAGYSGDGGPATSAKLQHVVGVAVDSSGNLFILCTNGQSVMRKVTASTGIITTVAGTGVDGYNGDGIAATSAQLQGPTSMVVDQFGNIFIAETNGKRIRKVTASTGIISTVTGTGTAGYNGDGIPATSAQLNYPFGVAVDSSGNLYITENTGKRVRKVTASTGLISTIAGTGTASFTGDGGPATSATFSSPLNVALDSFGNIYITDNTDAVVRKVTVSTGIINTVVGNHVAGYLGDGGPATSAELKSPRNVALDNFGNMYISDFSNYRIRAVGQSTPMTISCTPGPPTYGPTSCTANVGGSSPTGTIEWEVNWNAVATDSLSGTYDSISNPAGCQIPHCTIGAVYSGDSYNFPGIASTTLTISKATPALSVTCSPNPITYGPQTTTCASSLSGGASPSGSIAWTINGGAWTTTGVNGSATGLNGLGSANYTIGVAYAGDANNNTASSSTVVTIGKRTPTVTTWPTASSITYGQGLASSTLTGGTASLDGTFAWSSPGTWPVAGTASYSVTFTPTDTTDYTTVVGSGSVTVSKANRTASVSCSPNPTTYGNAQTVCIGTVSAGSGSMVFTYNGGTAWTTVGISGGIAGTTGFGGAAAATYQVTVTAVGDANYNDGATATVNFVIQKAMPTVTVWPTTTSITYGQTLASSTLSGGTSTPAGTFAWTTPSTAPGAGTAAQSVTFTPTDTTDYNTVVGSASVAVSKATQTITFTAPPTPVNFGVLPVSLAASGGASGNVVVFSVVSGPATIAGSTLTITGAGTVVVAANQAGNTNYSAASQVTQNVTVNKASPSVVLTSTVNPSTYGRSATFTATVPAGATGTVTFMNGATVLGSGSVTSGTATLTTSALNASSYSITAVYSGDGNFISAASTALPFVVSPLPADQLTVTLTSSLNPSTYGDQVDYTSTVSASVGGTPTGTVTLMDGATSLGTGTLDGSGRATITVPLLYAGSHSVTASYSGDANFL
jgi:hypothetical protein